MEAIRDAQPPARLELDQTHCTVDSKLRRVALMVEHGALDKRSIFIGDDDLTALALARFAQVTGGASARFALTVIDVDTELLGFIGEQAARLGLPIELVEHDLATPLPASVTGSYDVAYTDPPYTVPGPNCSCLARWPRLQAVGGSTAGPAAQHGGT